MSETCVPRLIIVKHKNQDYYLFVWNNNTKYK